MKKPSVVSVGENQIIEACVTLVTKATRKATRVAIRGLIERGVLNRQNIEYVRARGNEVVARITVLVKERFAEIAEDTVVTIQSCLKRIFEGKKIVIAKTSGKENLANAKDVFTGWVDPNFVNYGCDVEDKPTVETPVEVFEMVEDGDFARIFGGFNVNLDQLCLSQHQIKEFVKNHRDKLRTDGYATFFLFKVGKKFFVANVYFDDAGRLKVRVHRFSHDYGWDAANRHRVVVPQQKLVS
ncbi:MAG: hypothetical protein WCS89_00575 [Candidatus Paceibacterota bacterium]|jgi:hypothetical protein